MQQPGERRSAPNAFCPSSAAAAAAAGGLTPRRQPSRKRSTSHAGSTTISSSSSAAAAAGEGPTLATGASNKKAKKCTCPASAAGGATPGTPSSRATAGPTGNGSSPTGAHSTFHAAGVAAGVAAAAAAATAAAEGATVARLLSPLPPLCMLLQHMCSQIRNLQWQALPLQTSPHLPSNHLV
jgi:hypothetical protein